MTAIITLPQFPIVAGVEVPMDSEGRYNLNALHKASGDDPKDAPSQWLRRVKTKALIAEMETVQKCIVSYEGRNGGTFAVEELAVAYATWISPKFFKLVIRVFLDFQKGRLQPEKSLLEKMHDLAHREDKSRRKASENVRGLSHRAKVKKQHRVEAEHLLNEVQMALPFDLLGKVKLH